MATPRDKYRAAVRDHNAAVASMRYVASSEAKLEIASFLKRLDIALGELARDYLLKTGIVGKEWSEALQTTHASILEVSAAIARMQGCGAVSAFHMPG